MVDELDALRTDVARHRGAARAHPLMQLAAGLTRRYWVVGVGSPAGRPSLDEAVVALEEAHDLFEPGSGPRRAAAEVLGQSLGIRHIAHGSPAHDRDRAIDLLSGTVPTARPPTPSTQFSTVLLGMLLAFRGVRSGNVVQLFTAARSGATGTDLERSAELLRGVADGPRLSADLTSTARTLLEIVGIMRTLLGGGPGLAGHLGGFVESVRSLHALQQRLADVRRIGFGAVPGVFGFRADEIARGDPLRRPVLVVDGLPDEAPPAVPRARPTARPPTPADTFRDAVREVLSSPTAMLALLDDPAPPLEVTVVDRLVARCSCLVEAPGSVGTDRLLLAVALYLRGRDDADTGSDGDLRAARETLLDAAGALVDGPEVTVARRLADALDGLLPSGAVRRRLEARLGGTDR
jgi:hypothetical protein